MNYYLLQFCLAAQNDDFEKYMNILFLVVLAAFWLIGGIVKVKSEQAKRRKSKQPPRDSASRPSAASKDAGELILEKILGSFIPDSAVKQRSVSQQTFKKPPDSLTDKPKHIPKSRADKLALRQKMNQMRKQRLLSQKQSVEPKFDELTPIDADIQKLPEFTAEAVKNIEPSYRKDQTTVTMSQYLPDFSESDSLRKAILYYEVLGRPLSLRDSSDPFMGL
jgi:hypothetical protein